MANEQRKSVTFTAQVDAKNARKSQVGIRDAASSVELGSLDVGSDTASTLAPTRSASTPTLAGTQSAEEMRRKLWTVSRKAASMKKINPLKQAPDVDLTLLFQIPYNQKSPEMVKFFWKELKMRLIRKYGNLEKAFRSVDFSGDGAISFYEFSSLLKSMGIHLYPRFLRFLFDKVSGDDKEMSYDEFLSALMASTLEKMSKHMKQIEANTYQVHSHINAFMRKLVFATEENKSAACDRFQRKMTKKVVKAFWSRCRKFTMRTSKRTCDAKQFVGLMKLCRHFLSYEEQFLVVLHSEVDRLKSGTVDLVDLMTTVVLITDWSKKDQLEFLFRIFDFDCDDCLTSDQILVLYTSILIHAPMVLRNKTVCEGNKLFNDELALQEARRLFHLTIDSLDLADGARSLVNFEELYGVFVQYPFMLDSLLPGLNNCRWLLRDGEQSVPESKLPPVNGTSEASTFRRDISKTFLSVLREEPVEFHGTTRNWNDVHRDTFQSWAAKAFENGQSSVEKAELENTEQDNEKSILAHSLSAPVISLARQKIARLADPIKTQTLAAVSNAAKDGLPEITAHRFGQESIPRFLMYSAAKTSSLRHCATLKEKETIPYRCPVCSTKTMPDYHDICIGGNE